MDFDPIVYPSSAPRFPCRIHGTTPCSSACRGKVPLPTARRSGKTYAAELYRKMVVSDPLYQALMKGPEVPMHWLEPTEYVPLCIVRGTCAKREVECRTTRNTLEVTCPECITALNSAPCRHRNGTEDCGPLCLLLFGDAFYTEMVEVPRLGDRPEDVQRVPGELVHRLRDEEDDD